MAKKLCLRCGSNKLDDADVVGYYPGLQSRNSKKVLGLVWHTPPVPNRAEVCEDCGFTSFFVNPEEYRQKQKRGD